MGEGGREALGGAIISRVFCRKRPLIDWVTTNGWADWLVSPGDNRWFHLQMFEVIGFK